MDKKYEAIIFDCDGVLVDSEVLAAEAWIKLLAMYNVDADLKTILHDFHGGNIHFSLDYIIKLIGPTDKITLERSYRSIVHTMFQNSLKAIDGIHEFLINSSLKRCIASNGPMEKILSNLSITELISFFDENLIFSGQRLGMFKPDPSLFLYSISQMQLSPEQCIVIEDSRTGIIAAQNAGIDVIYYNANNTPLDVSPTAIFSTMKDIFIYIHN